MSDYFACVGSRNTPLDVLKVMIRLGKTLTDLGYTITSGDAYGADRAFYYGAKQSKYFKQNGAKIYVIHDGFLGRSTDDDVFIDVRKFKDMKETYQKLAQEARGTLKGLNEKGIALHSRNVLQILGPTLEDKADGIFFYAQTVGKNKVKGGTNTAYQLAKSNQVGIIKNLYLEDDLNWCLDWLKENETTGISAEIDWSQILEPKFDYVPSKDGVDHINIYSKSTNKLGYLLSNWAHSPFDHPIYGRFNNIECFYAYLASGEQLEHLRTASGWEGKSILKELSYDEKESNLDLVKDALYLKFAQNPTIRWLFDEYKTLPIVHYYWYGDETNPKVIPNQNSTWLEDTWNKIRSEYLTDNILKMSKGNYL